MLPAGKALRDVAFRAQLVANEARVRRAVLLTPPASAREAVRKLSDAGLRILRTSLTAISATVDSYERPSDVLPLADTADLVVVPRRRTFPWLLAPLSLYVRRVLRRTRTPVLIVGGPPEGAYRHVVIATDLTTDMNAAIAAAKRVAPRASITVLHAYRGMFEGRLQASGVPEKVIATHRIEAQREAAKAMMAALDPKDGTIRHARLTYGFAVPEILGKARELGADLIVVTRSTYSWWAEVLGVNVSLEIAARADADVLVAHQRRVAR